MFGRLTDNRFGQDAVRRTRQTVERYDNLLLQIEILTLRSREDIEAEADKRADVSGLGRLDALRTMLWEARTRGVAFPW